MAVIKDRCTRKTTSKNSRVVLSRKRYEELMEDLHDLAIVAERKDESEIGLEEMTKRLRKRGLL